MKKQSSDAFARLTDWLENGDQSLEEEMEASLEEDITAAAGSDRPARPFRFTATAAVNRLYQKIFPAAAAAVCLLLTGLLLFAALRMPAFGASDDRADTQVPDFYVENTLKDTGAVNVVTGIILDYRGFDTLGESHVLFIAVCTVLLMLSIRGENNEQALQRISEEERFFEPRHDAVLQGCARILTPLVFVFGLYIIFNGHLSPGGGFSGGAVLGAGLILYHNAFGYEKTERFFTYRTFKYVSLFSLLFYSLAKGYHFFTGANGIESGIPKGTPGNIFSAGLLLPLNIVVGLVVACTMYALYTMFRRGDF